MNENIKKFRKIKNHKLDKVYNKNGKDYMNESENLDLYSVLHEGGDSEKKTEKASTFGKRSKTIDYKEQ